MTNLERSDVQPKKLEFKLLRTNKGWFFKRDNYSYGPIPYLPELLMNEKQLQEIYKGLKLENEAEKRQFNHFLLCSRLTTKQNQRVEEKVEVDPSKYFENDKFVPQLLAEGIMDQRSFITSEQSKETFVWRDGYYQSGGEIEIERLCKEFLEGEFRRNRYGEVLEYIKASTFTEIVTPPIDLINVKNGILNIKNTSLSPHNPFYHFFNKIPIEYNPKADTPLVRKFLSEIAASEDDVQVLVEVAGYCLYRGYPIHKALALVGEGANGKSTYLSLIKAFLGSENTSSRSLLDLEMNRFAKASLFGKLANIYADLSDDVLRRTGTFKMLTGGDLIEAEKKFRDSFTFVSYCKLLFSCNKLPAVHDNTDAFFRRWIILIFPNTFTEDKCDLDILKKITAPEELSGFLNMALDGLRRILSNGEFSSSTTIDAIREDYIRKSDPLAAFVLDCLQESQESMIIKQELYSLFAYYCREKKLPAVNRDTFFKNLSKHISVTQVRINRKDIKGRPFAFKGISLTDKGRELWSKQSIQSKLSDILMKEDSKGESFRNIKMEKRVDSVDSLDHSKSIRKNVICGQCICFHTENCIHSKFQLIQRTATYPSYCQAFKLKEITSSMKV